MPIRPGLPVAAAVVALLLTTGTACGRLSGIERTSAHAIASPSPSAPACTHQPGGGFPPLLVGFDERLATEPSVAAGPADPAGLVVTVLIQGACSAVAPGQTVTTNYVGVTLRDGKVFDSSWSRNATVDVVVGLGQLGQTIQVIEGWDRGLVGVRVGSRVQLDIPARMAYGNDPSAGTPTGSLRFVVDILDART